TTRGMFARPTKHWIDSTRTWTGCYPYWEPGEQPWNRWNFYNSHGRHKLSMTIDLSKPEGHAIAQRLVAVSDLLIENNVPENVDRWGLEWETLRRIKPDLVALRMPGYGLTGAYRDFRSYGSHIEGASGHTYIRGYEDSDPTTTDDIFFGDSAAAATAAFAAVTALLQARRTGRGQLIELAQTETVINHFPEVLLDYQMNQRIARQAGNDLYPMAPHNTYRCLGDDRWIAIAAGNDAEWQGLLEVMRHPEWASNARFATQQGRWEHRRELDEHIEAWTTQQHARWLMDRLQAEGVPAGTVNDDRDAYEDPHLNARGFFATIHHPPSGTHRYPGIVWKMANTPNSVRRGPATLGQDNDHAYRQLLGITDAEWSRLEAQGHIGTEYAKHLA
ncbi:MAG: CoA transferase, partial [Chloroflexi bacterium]|nr:CoA transferase [Chloroflexota bacterium]